MQSIAWEYPKPLDFRNASSENWNVTEEITNEGSAPGHDTILEALHSTGQELAKAGETLSRADARKLMLASLARYGLTPETLAKYAKAGLEAMEVKVTFFRGEFHETEVPDWPTRYKFFAEINRIFGAAAPQ